MRIDPTIRRRLAVILVLTVGASLAAAGWICVTSVDAFLMETFTDRDGDDWAYGVFVPAAPPPTTGYSAVLFLHGAGERGDDGTAPLRSGLAAAVRARAGQFPFLVIIPQAVESWAPGGPDASRALGILHQVCDRHRGDRSRVCLTGFSLGGAGAWELAAADPLRWSCVVPVAGWASRELAGRLRDTPCRCFHGAADRVVSPDADRRLVAALRELGSSVEYVEWPDAGHGIDRRVYENDALWEWVAAQPRRGPGPPGG